MGKKDKAKNKRKTFIGYYWPYLLVALGPIVIWLIIAVIYSLATHSNFLLTWEFYGTVFLMFVYFLLLKLSYFGFVVAALILSIPLLILLFGAVISAKKAKKAKADISDKDNQE
ncbi:hypothetical protein B0O40_1837 [Ruminococcaceae bacterium R-25]|nr:hypothetical protein B0O40_1837 [Ruminococcaceae bacterium R-25]SUQ21701.1 hypothetical protein SAMN06297423_1837 [Oscillospiraceae bacterium]